MKKVNIFWHISESETHILYRFITHRVQYFKPLFLTILMIMTYFMIMIMITTKNAVSQKIRILHKINKMDILNRNVRLLKSILLYMHSTLGWASFCMNYCINAAWHGGDQPAALLGCNGSPGYFDSSLQVICIVGSGVSSSSWFSMGFR